MGVGGVGVGVGGVADGGTKGKERGVGSGTDDVGQLCFLFGEEKKRKPTDLRIFAYWLKEAIKWPQRRDL